MDRLKFDLLMLDAMAVIAPIAFVGAILWSGSSAGEEPAGVYVNGKRVVCSCESCACGPGCKCADGECACEGCQAKAEPVRLVLFTAVDYCVPCIKIAPHWKQVSEENPGLCETIDLSDFDAPVAEHPLAKEYGVTSVPTLVRVVDSKADKVSKIGDVNTLQAMRDVVKRWRAGE